MKIILNQDVFNLGEEGDICEVAAGYARNYLLPQKMAFSYNTDSLRILDSKRSVIDTRKEQKRGEALGLKEKLEEAKIVFLMSAGENGKLFGSVTPALIVEELEKLGFNIERKRLEIPDNHIRQLGEYSVRIRLYGQEEANLRVVVEKAEK